MKFKVYNGPMIRIFSDGLFLKEMLPICRSGRCTEHICDWMSDQWCFRHATEYVKEWDRQNEVQREN